MALNPQQIQDLISQDLEHCCDGYGPDQICVRIVAIAELPTRFGQFQVVAFYNNKDGKEHAALIHGDVIGAEDVPVRIHSECLTGDVFGSLRCDCRDQLETALCLLGQMDKGLLLYLRQEGRGIGFINKIRAYSLQDRGLDTVEANLALGFRDDERDYWIAAHMLDSLKVRSIRLMTNNPRKIRELRQYGIRITERIPLVIPANPFNEFYLRTKAIKSGHMIEPNGRRHLREQMDFPGEERPPSPEE
ncbi:MAG: GTP cyclohydrolase II [Anaerolineales bacterium]|nr:GTP cyclohydrolase II [Anaerolineales bacterium]MCS7246719.1 GTP cyclohydrolase II [Anaerolineales bacterium]MDW8160529.1 GTP cyclohydrolase II [Anaerolineales bacterium]MDW8448103.1 GTP cyclohydrolase II [Anaerolineales bacterium]